MSTCSLWYDEECNFVKWYCQSNQSLSFWNSEVIWFDECYASIIYLPFLFLSCFCTFLYLFLTTLATIPKSLQIPLCFSSLVCIVFIYIELTYLIFFYNKIAPPNLLICRTLLLAVFILRFLQHVSAKRSSTLSSWMLSFTSVLSLTFVIVLYLSVSIVNMFGKDRAPATIFELVVLFFCFIYVVLQIVVSIYLSVHRSPPMPYTDLFDDGELDDNHRFPRAEGGSFLSFLMISWANPMLKLGSIGRIRDVSDLFQLPSDINIKQSAMLFEPYVNILSRSANLPEKDKQKSQISNFSLIKVFLKYFGKQFYYLGFLQIVTDTCRLLTPVFLNFFIKYLSNEEGLVRGVYYGVAMIFLLALSGFFDNYVNYIAWKVGVRIRGTIMVAIYRKALSVSRSDSSKFTVGEIVNFMSRDAKRLGYVPHNFVLLIYIFFNMFTIMFLIYGQIGPSMFIALIICVIMLPLNQIMASLLIKTYQELLVFKDQRVKLISEVLSGIKSVKFSSYEKEFQKLIEKFRNREIKKLRKLKILDGVTSYIWDSFPVFISLAIFTSYALFGNDFEADTIFTTVAYINLLLGPLTYFPWIMNATLEQYVSFKRIQGLFILKKFDKKSYYTDFGDPTDKYDIEVEKGIFSWSQSNGTSEDEATTQKLKDIFFNVQKGSFIGVIGEVGSGKTSLLSAICGEMIREYGSIYISNDREGFGIFTQVAWLQNGTIKENILMGKVYDKNKYKEIIDACALKEDLKILKNGDLTEIGENGVALSGGQKARVTLARAVYQDKPIYLLDDPLSAVDAHVGKHILNNCINGLLANKTRVLFTHHLDSLHEADSIVVMKQGKIIDSGFPEKILSQYTDMVLKENDHPRSRHHSSHSGRISFSNVSDKGNFERALSYDNNPSMPDYSVPEEQQASGSIPLKLCWEYAVAMGAFVAVLTLILTALSIAFKNISELWLTVWTDAYAINATNVLSPNGKYTVNSSLQYTQTSVPDNKFYLIIYVVLALTNNFFVLCASFVPMIGFVRASKKVHENLLESVLKFTANVFATTPLGRIVNRLANDIDVIDTELNLIIPFFFSCFFTSIGIFILIMIAVPIISPAILVLVIIYFCLQRYYRSSSREIRRVSSVTNSPIFTHFAETLNGLEIVRGMRAQKIFLEENLRRVNKQCTALFNERAIERWLAIRLQIIGVFVLVCTIIFGIIEKEFLAFEISAGLIGLAISYSLSLKDSLGESVNFLAETEKNMVSFERVTEYSKDIEKEDLSGEIQILKGWPQFGRIEFIDVDFSYSPLQPLVLKKVNFTVDPGEKVGIVGRTGAGKSSLLIVFFRMCPILDGKIIVDGIDIHKLPVREYRKVISIIPQDPFLFKGSVRENVDIRGEFKDEEILKAIERAHFKEAVMRLGGLDADVGENGQHFSAGQKQLLCLARAMLSNTKILCLDEATANVDVQTDKLVQETIRKEFATKTVLTIAHRINTIADYDRILVMDEGEVVENDSPQNLLADSSSRFAKIVNEANL